MRSPLHAPCPPSAGPMTAMSSGRANADGGAAAARPRVAATRAMGSVIVASVWRGFPFWFICILAALQSIPGELYDAARVDGANAWQRFRDVTLPGIKQVIIVTTLLSSIWTANAFEHVWLLTQGGPSDATMVFPVLAYFGMQTQRIGEAAAVSVYMLPVLGIFVILATALMMRDEDQ